MRIAPVSISSETTDGSVEGGVYTSVVFLPSSDFDGTIKGVSFLGSDWSVIPFGCGDGEKLGVIEYTFNAGTLKIAKVA